MLTLLVSVNARERVTNVIYRTTPKIFEKIRRVRYAVANAPYIYLDF
jgi:hypothetical protein